VSVFATASCLCLGQEGMRGKGNETTTIYILLDIDPQGLYRHYQRHRLTVPNQRRLWRRVASSRFGRAQSSIYSPNTRR
jgi:hypothetical protein